MTISAKEIFPCSAQNGVIYATSPNPDLILIPIMNSFSSPQNGILNQPIRNHPISTSEVICLTDPYHPLKESDLARTKLLFASIITSLFLPPSAYKVFHLVQLLQAPFCLLHWILPNT